MLFQQSAQYYLLSIFNPMIILLFITFGILELRKGMKKNPYNLNLAIFYLITAFGILVNVYMALFWESIPTNTYTLLGRISALLIHAGLLTLQYFLMGINFGYKGILKWQKTLYWSIIGLIAVGWLFIGDIDIIIVDSGYQLLWNWQIGEFGISTQSIVVISAVFFCKTIRKKIQYPSIRKRFIAYSTGHVLLQSSIFLTIFMNLGILNRSIGAVLYTTIMPFYIILIYYGTQKKIN